MLDGIDYSSPPIPLVLQLVCVFIPDMRKPQTAACVFFFRCLLFVTARVERVSRADGVFT